MRLRRFAVPFLLVLLPPCAPGKNTCVDCHGALDGNLQAPARNFPQDVHARHGFTCTDCHAGDANSDDPVAAMDAKRGFRGKIARTAVPDLCGGCHANAVLIHRFKPQQRVDQLVQYRTSVHGKRLAAGDTAVANCVDCHSVHDIREVRDPQSPVHPLKVADTCGRCHADSRHMARYGIPTDQLQQYRHSVHWEALARRGDISAPSCPSCHGNHGATPPRVSSVRDVCGGCHVLFEDLYNKSPHAAVFTAMQVGGCIVCHGNHRIRMPSVAMLSGTDGVCTRCHDAASKGGRAAVQMARSISGLEKALQRSDEILSRARSFGMEVSDAQMRQMEVRERLVKARVAVHAFQLAPVAAATSEGMAIARETYRAGEDALREKDRRRVGLGLSLITILVVIGALLLWIRSIEKPRVPVRETSGGEL